MQPFSTPALIAILGYGAPAEPLRDGNLMTYLDGVVRAIGRPRLCDEIHLMGGCTNRPDVSEADAMRMWFEEHQHNFVQNLRCDRSPMTARESVERFAQKCRGHLADEGLMIFCEYSRRHMIRMLAAHFLPGRKVWVRGIRFDEPSLTRRNRFYQAGPRLAFEWLALHNRRFDQMHAELRMHHIMNARAATAAEQQRA